MPIWNTPLYRRWYNIKSRCENPRNEKYPLYGARGIYVESRWQNFENFLKDMGHPPSPTHTLDRIDVNGPYSHWNCRWATPEEQANNKRQNVNIRFNGKVMTSSQWAKHHGLSRDAVRQRILNGMTPEEAASKPRMKMANRLTPVRQTELGTGDVHYYDCLAAAAATFGEKKKTALKGIYRVLTGERKSYKGSFWEYAESVK